MKPPYPTGTHCVVIRTTPERTGFLGLEVVVTDRGPPGIRDRGVFKGMYSQFVETVRQLPFGSAGYYPCDWLLPITPDPEIISNPSKIEVKA